MKDVGRKIKCKKCSASLRVTEKGLEEDDGRATDEPKPAAVAEADDRDDRDRDEDDRPTKKPKREKGPRGPGLDPMAVLASAGGIPTLVFGFGVFLVIVFTALPIIGVAGSDRAAAYVDKLELERTQKLEALVPKGKKDADLSEGERNKITEDTKKINEDYDKRLKEARNDAASTKIGNRRDVWMERYGLMFGFLAVAFGCLGFLRTEQPLTLRIVAAVILGAMMLAMFGMFAGCTGRAPIG